MLGIRSARVGFQHLRARHFRCSTPFLQEKLPLKDYDQRKRQRDWEDREQRFSGVLDFVEYWSPEKFYKFGVVGVAGTLT